MSKGPGHVERTIAAAFTANPSKAFTVERLAELVYPDAAGIEDKHRVAVRRAAKGMGWHSERVGHEIVYRKVASAAASAGRQIAEPAQAATPTAPAETAPVVAPEREFTKAELRAHRDALPVKETFADIVAILEAEGKKSVVTCSPATAAEMAVKLRRKLMQLGIDLNT